MPNIARLSLSLSRLIFNGDVCTQQTAIINGAIFHSALIIFVFDAAAFAFAFAVAVVVIYFCFLHHQHHHLTAIAATALTGAVSVAVFAAAVTACTILHSFCYDV